MDWISLAQLIKECADCPLYVVGQGVPGAAYIDYQQVDPSELKPRGIMIIGEAPGTNEQRVGVPFIGQAGQLLQELLIKAEISEYYITNVAKHLPPLRQGNHKPNKEEAAECRPYLDKEIEMVDPSRIILLGAVAAKLIVPKGNPAMRKIVGTRKEIDGRVYQIAYHPSYLLRSKGKEFKYAALESQVLTTLVAAKEGDQMPEYNIVRVECLKNHRT